MPQPNEPIMVQITKKQKIMGNVPVLCDSVAKMFIALNIKEVPLWVITVGLMRRGESLETALDVVTTMMHCKALSLVESTGVVTWHGIDGCLCVCKGRVGEKGKTIHDIGCRKDGTTLVDEAQPNVPIGDGTHAEAV
jgi:hypothetical protein